LQATLQCLTTRTLKMAVEIIEKFELHRKSNYEESDDGAGNIN